MNIRYILTKSEYDELKDANLQFNRVKNLMQESKFYDNEKTVPAMVLSLIERERGISAKLKEARTSAEYHRNVSQDCKWPKAILPWEESR